MAHVRLNEREPNPNPHINFISALPAVRAAAHEDARQLLRALAAQVRPIMKAHGFTVNSFEEYTYNKVFAGRNWGGGEVVELVLRGASGAFYPVSWLLGTLCHELAHNEHDNHGPAFQALWAQLCREVRDLQDKGYYGDGYWSSGTRLADSARIAVGTLSAGELPEYTCGGAHARARPTARRRKAGAAGPSNTTGAQTAKRRKVGARVTAKDAFVGEGRALTADRDGFGRSAKSKKAREERAAAAERRVAALQGQASSSTSVKDTPSDEEDVDEPVPETDADRRREMGAMDKDELDLLRVTTKFADEFVFPEASASGRVDANSTPEDNIVHGSGGAAAPGVTGQAISGSKGNVRSAGKGKGKGNSLGGAASGSGSSDQRELEDWFPIEDSSQSSVRKTLVRKEKSKLSYGALVKDEVQTRKKEALGLIGGDRKLGGEPVQRAGEAASGRGKRPGEWTCLVCTLLNEPGHLACSACATPREKTTWSGESV